jgi:hypothetical protein
VHSFATDPASGLPDPRAGARHGLAQDRFARLSQSRARGAEAERSRSHRVPRRIDDVLRRASATTRRGPRASRQRFAAKHPNASIDYVNAGVPGYRLEFIQKNLELRVKPLAPDVIVLYEATNDLIQDTTDLAKAQGLFAGQADPDDALAEVSLLCTSSERTCAPRRARKPRAPALDSSRSIPRRRCRVSASATRARARRASAGEGGRAP